MLRILLLALNANALILENDTLIGDLDRLSSQRNPVDESAEVAFHRNNLRLFNDLTHHYKRELSPYYTNHHLTDLPAGWTHPPPMSTEVSLTYARIVKLDQVEQTMKVIAEFRMVWTDYRLRWNPADYGGITYIYMNRAAIWTPEITVANSEQAADASPEYKQNVLINATGHVLFYYDVLANSVCRLETDFFPFDEQKCPVCLLETFFNKNESTVYATVADRFSNQEAGNGEWDVLDVRVYRRTLVDYERVEFDMMCYNFTVKRKANFYVMVIIIPTFIITALTITGIFGKRITGDNCIDELTLGLTSLMTMTVMLGIVADSLPKTNHFPVLSVFLSIDVTLMATSILLVLVHPHVIHPNVRKLKSRFRSAESPKQCCCGLLPSSLRKYHAAHLFFMFVFQSINIANLLYVLSYWT